eukprot:TRINITY_DN1828_c0_g1_i1.p1 TRINITY_DN1828_c0_g1~~TRINITY_DN1828_c0_g1_i1.p1  ORF type:complete len:319 (+),score=28.88 TRINITY_DN1828_c0_g1_i1:40-996(+)
MHSTFGGRQPFSRGVLHAGMTKKRPEDAESLYPPCFKRKVNEKRVKMDAIVRWAPRRVVQLLGYEDEVVVSYVTEMLKDGGINPRSLQVALTGFLNEKAPVFTKDLWDLMLDGQNQPDGVPTQLALHENLDETPIDETDFKQRLKEFSKEMVERVGADQLAEPPSSVGGAAAESKEQDQRESSREHKHRRRDRKERRDHDRDGRRARSRSRSGGRSRQQPRRWSRSPRRRRQSRSPRRERSPYRSPRKGSPRPRKGSPPPRKGSRSPRKGSRSPRKGSRSPPPRKRTSGSQSPPPRKITSGSQSPPPRKRDSNSKSPA